MRTRGRRLLGGALGAVLLLATAPALLAQEQEESADITELIRLDVAPDQATAFEEGVKAHHENVEAQGVERPVIIWEAATGKHSGSYYVGLVGRTWADFGESTADDPEALEQSVDENIAPHVTDYHASFWRHAAELSYQPGEGGEMNPLTTVTFFELDYGEGEAFTNAVRQIKEAAQEADYEGDAWNTHQLEYGGGPVWAIVSGQNGWADLAEPETTLGDVLEEQMGEYEMDALFEQVDEAVEDTRSEILRYREELSYRPGQDGGGQ